MDNILILVSNKNNQILLKRELGKRYSIILPNRNLQELEFDLIIIDGFELKKRQNEIREIRNKSFPLFLPVILLTTRDDISLAEKFLYEIVDELIRIPIEKIELRVRLDILLRARFYTRMLAQETITDPLTGTYNKKFLYETAQREIAHFQRYGRKFSIIFIDIDDFKKINDKFGHLSGDMVLKTLTEKLKSCLRKSDFVCRFGGEEFVIFLHGADTEKALTIAERIRQEIENEKIKTYDGQYISTTVSMGIATVDETTKDIQELLDKADMAMYRAKTTGKNRVCL
ncbi:MAG: diguanylate cyclase [Proteobacteria bacterium]|nr:diguanylate cyclase [Pseudomonadota bacterium]